MERQPQTPRADRHQPHHQPGHRLPWPDAFALQLVVCVAMWLGVTFGLGWWLR